MKIIDTGQIIIEKEAKNGMKVDRKKVGASYEDEQNAREEDLNFEGREKYELDIDRMINEGLGGGYISDQNGLISDNTIEEV